MGISQDLYKKAKTLIPGGTQLLSKRPEQFLPDLWPAYYDSSKGCSVWDLDGNKYTDMSYMGIGACILGYSDPDVNRAAMNAIKKGSMNTLNAPEEVELAELLCDLHPWASMVRYTRSGGEAMTVAVRIARAKTGKEKVLFCGYHGWHDWYLAANLSDDKALDGHLIPGLQPAGVPRALKGTSFPFYFNDTRSFLKLIEAHEKDTGVVVLESIRNDPPQKEFIETIRDVTRKNGIVLIFDEITAGWRLCDGGAHLTLGVNPDIAVFGKGISNGFSIGAVIGTSDVMQAAQTSFISSTYWTERIGPSAALAAIRKMRKLGVHKKLVNNGKKVMLGWRDIAARNGLEIDVGGIEPLGHFSFKAKEPLVLKTLFTQWMLDEGFLATTAYYASLAHNDTHIKNYLDASGRVFSKIADAVRNGDPAKMLKGPVCHSGFKRLN